MTTPFSRLLGGDWGVGMRPHVINGAFPALPILYHCEHKLKQRPRNDGTLSPDTSHGSWSPLHSPSGEGRGQGELSR